MATSNTITVDELMEQYRLTEEQCNYVITDAHLMNIARNLVEDWRSLFSKVEMPQILKNNIERDFTKEQEKKDAFFAQWKRRNGHTATYKKLISALLAIDNRADAEGVCKIMLVKSPHPQLEYEDCPLHEQNLTSKVFAVVAKGGVAGALAGAIVGALAVGTGMGQVNYAVGGSTAVYIASFGPVIPVVFNVPLILARHAMDIDNKILDDFLTNFLVLGGLFFLALTLIFYVLTGIYKAFLFAGVVVGSWWGISVFGVVTGAAAEAFVIGNRMWLLCVIGVVGAKVGADVKVLAIGVGVGLLFGSIFGRRRATIVIAIFYCVEVITFIYILIYYH